MNPTPDTSRLRATRPASRLVRGAGADRAGDFPMRLLQESPYFDRFDIAEAYAVMEWDWNRGGWLRERPSNQRRMEATSVQLGRLQFRARPNLEFRTLTRNGRAIYRAAARRFGLLSA